MKGHLSSVRFLPFPVPVYLVPVSNGRDRFMELRADDGRVFMAFSLIFLILAVLSTQRLGECTLNVCVASLNTLYRVHRYMNKCEPCELSLFQKYDKSETCRSS